MQFLPTKSYEPEYAMSLPAFEEGVDFFSRFESGNLKRAIRVSKCEYELHLSEDYNTTGHCHWFYFKTISNLPKNSSVCFRIVNMTKPSSLYSEGLRPFAYSLRKNCGWVPAGDSVSYYPNTQLSNESKHKLYCLEWRYTYEYENDDVYFAQLVPYSYSDLLDYLKGIKKEKKVLRLDVLCKTLAKNVCPMLTITENIESFLPFSFEQEMAIKSKNTRRIIQDHVGKMATGLCQPKPFKTGEVHRRMRTRSELEDWPDAKNADLELALLQHKRVHGFKKGVIITARVHPGSFFLTARRSPQLMDGQRPRQLPPLKLPASQSLKAQLCFQNYPYAES